MVLCTMVGHRWDRDYMRAARPPPDVGQHAKDTVVAWGLLLFFAVILGTVIKLLGVNTNG